MHILFLSYDFPYPLTSGGKTRTYNLMKFAKGAHEISLFSFVRQPIKEEQRQALRDIGIQQVRTFPRRSVRHVRNFSSLLSRKHSIFHGLYYTPEVEKAILTEVKEKQIDIIHCESFYTGYYLSNALKNLGVKQIFGTENIEYKLYDAYIQHHVPAYRKPFYLHEANKIRQEEREMYSQADVCLAVRQDEADYISKESSTPTTVIENGVDLSYFHFLSKKRGERVNVLFVGNFSYFPNVQAMLFFYHEVFKLLDKHNLHLTIVGAKVQSLQLPEDERITTLPFVEDIRTAYAEADVFVSPVKIGGGTNFEILEAMASGVPVVALSDTASSVGIQDGKQALLASDAIAFRSQLERLVDDPELGQMLSRNARKFVEENYAWDIIGRKLQKVWEDLV